MIRTVALSVVAAAISLATPALASPKQKKPVDPDKRICRTEPRTGSLFGRQVCRTSAEWERDWKNGSQAVREGMTEYRSSGTRVN